MNGRNSSAREFGGNALARIGDGDPHDRLCPVRFAFDADLDAAAIGEFERVVDELEQDLAHAPGIGRDMGYACDGRHVEAKLFFPGPRLRQPRHRARCLRGIAFHLAAGLRPG